MLLCRSASTLSQIGTAFQSGLSGAENAIENRVDMFHLITEVEKFRELFGRQARGDVWSALSRSSSDN